MSKEVLWTREVYEEFVRLANLSELEAKVLKARVVDDWKIQRQALEFNVSPSTIDRVVSRLKVKYDACQKRSDILPPRNKKSVKF